METNERVVQICGPRVGETDDPMDIYPCETSDCLAYTFYNCTNLREVDLSNRTDLTSLRYTFSNCYNLSDVDLSMLTNVYDIEGAFQNMHNMSVDKLPPCVSNGTLQYAKYAFRGCDMSD